MDNILLAVYRLVWVEDPATVSDRHLATHVLIDPEGERPEPGCITGEVGGRELQDSGAVDGDITGAGVVCPNSVEAARIRTDESGVLQPDMNPSAVVQWCP